MIMEKLKLGLRVLRKSEAFIHGIPAPVLKGVTDEIDGDLVPKAVQEKLTKAVTYHEQTKNQVFFLTGKESPLKERVAVEILFFFLCLDKTIAYSVGTEYGNRDYQWPRAYAHAIVSIDLALGLATARLQTEIRNHLSRGRVLIISGTNKESIEEVLGESLMDYVSHNAMEIDLNVKRESIPKV